MAVKECCCAKLSPNKKSIFGMILGSQILYLLVIAGILAVVSADTEESCKNVKNFYERKGIIKLVNIQEQPNSDVEGLCLNRGCCGVGARAKLLERARSQLEQSLWSELSKLADILANRARKFDESFRKLLQLSREEFHNMFKRTYGMIYEQHSYVFEQLFEELNRYYTRGDLDFDRMMEGFFGILYQKMFTVVNSQYIFDEKYLKCVNEHMRDIKPFEDVPSKLSVQLRRAFVATRTFHKALRTGSEIVRNMMKVGVTNECVAAWARLRFCGTCGGLQPPACSRYCHNVVRGCLPAHADLGDQWDAYVDAVEKVADRLLGPFNIAMVVQPIDIKISEAIMNFQDHNQEISQKIFSGCGKPVLGGSGGAGPFFTQEKTRQARSIPDFDWKATSDNDFEIEASFESIPDDPSLLNFRSSEDIRKATAEMAEQSKSRERFLEYMRGHIDLDEFEEHERKRRDAAPEPEPGSEIDFKAYEFDGKRGGGKKKKPSAAKTDYGRSKELDRPAIDQLVRETRSRVRSSRKYWSHLPGLLCASASVTSSPCYNGSAVGTYTPGPAGEGSAALASNPEVRGAESPAGGGGAVARAQQDALRTLTARLKDAYNGVEVQWRDADDPQWSPKDQQAAGSSSLDVVGGGEGSGSGSGDFTDDTEDLPDDDEDRNEYGEGSGDRQPDIVEPAATEPASRPPAPEPPFVPSIVDGPNTNNVQLRGRTGDAPQDPVDVGQPEDTSSDSTADQQPPPVREQPVAGSADRPSLQKALFTYALPVVCAWFGTIVTDLF